MSDAALQQLREDALTMLVLWATTQEYSADIEQLLKQWATTFQISDTDLMQRLQDATTGDLQRPPDSRTGLGHSLELQTPTPTAAAAAAATGPFATGGGTNKRAAAAADDRGGSKRYKQTIPAVLDPSEYPYANIGPAIGRKVLRYWPKDAYRNKGDPWFSAVVTDYEEDTGAHIVTYQFGTQKEEKERVSLALKQPNELRLTDDAINLLEWYIDPKKRKKSSAVEKSVFLRKQYQAQYGGSGAPGGPKGKGKSGKANSNSALSSGYSL